MDDALPVVGLAVLVLSGIGVTSLITGGRLRSPVELFSVGCVLGAGCVSLASFGLGFLFTGRTLHLAITGALVGLALWGAMVRRRYRADAPARNVRDLLPILPPLLLAAQFTFVTWLILTQPLGWDGLFVWEAKARTACLSGGRVAQEYFADASRRWSHPEYPLFLPLSESWIYAWAGRCDQGLAKLVFPLFYVTAVGVLYAGSRRLGSGRSSSFVAPLLLPLLPAVVVQNGSVSSGYADVPLAACYLAAVVYLLSWLRSGSADSLRLASALSALLPWIKTDGAVLWLSLVGVTSVTAIARRRVAPALVMAVPGLIVLGGWMLFTHASGARYQDFQFTSFAGIDRARAVTILRNLARELGRFSHWGVLWPAVGITGVLFAYRARDPARSMLLAAIVLPIALYSVVYHFSRWASLELHIQSSLHRLLLPSALVAILYIAAPLDRCCDARNESIRS